MRKLCGTLLLLASSIACAAPADPQEHQRRLAAAEMARFALAMPSSCAAIGHGLMQRYGITWPELVQAKGRVYQILVPRLQAHAGTWYRPDGRFDVSDVEAAIETASADTQSARALARDPAYTPYVLCFLTSFTPADAQAVVEKTAAYP